MAKPLVHSVYNESDVVSDLWSKKLTGKTLRDISRDYPGTTYGDIQRALKGEFPKSPQKRLAFRLPALAPAPVCPIHGIVHTRKTCPSDKPRKPNLFAGFVMIVPKELP